MIQLLWADDEVMRQRIERKCLLFVQIKTEGSSPGFLCTRKEMLHSPEWAP